MSRETTLPPLQLSHSLKGLLKDRVGIITGASSGIGAATAWAFAEAGAKLVLTARDQKALESVADAINSSLSSEVALAVPTDVTNSNSVQSLVRKTLQTHGRLDMAFNNAGSGHVPRPLAEIKEEDFDLAIGANIHGTFISMKYEIIAMLKGSGGTIVNMSSTAGLQGVKGISGYVAAKHAVIGLTRAAALDYGRQNIRVNVVAPGPIYTERLANPEIREKAAFTVPLGRVGMREEVASVAAWLCSDLASYVTGATISVDGGHMAGTWFPSRLLPSE